MTDEPVRKKDIGVEWHTADEIDFLKYLGKGVHRDRVYTSRDALLAQYKKYAVEDRMLWGKINKLAVLMYLKREGVV